MSSKLIIGGDVIDFEEFSHIDSGDTLNVSIYGKNKVFISKDIPKYVTLKCHNIIKLSKKRYQDKRLVAKLFEAGVKSGTEFLYIQDRYIADLI